MTIQTALGNPERKLQVAAEVLRPDIFMAKCSSVMAS